MHVQARSTKSFSGPFHLIYKPPMDENFWGGREFQRGCVHRHPLIFVVFFWGVRQKFLNFWGGVCLCRHFDLFFLEVQILLTSSIGRCVQSSGKQDPQRTFILLQVILSSSLHNEIYLRDVIRCPRKGGNFQQLHQIFTICSRYNLVSMPVRGLCSGNSITQLVLSFLRSVSDAVTARGLLLSNIPRPIFSLCPH
jgi:hypothetical protein